MHRLLLLLLILYVYCLLCNIYKYYEHLWYTATNVKVRWKVASAFPQWRLMKHRLIEGSFKFILLRWFVIRRF